MPPRFGTIHFSGIVCRQGGGEPSGDVVAAINQASGSFASFKETFTKAVTSLFGSDWTWLVMDSDSKISTENLANAGYPLRDGTPLLTLDVWEHAYYIDYRNARPDYVQAFWNIVNWDFVAENLRR
jgi:superoxide dismutase, Fe-Mn family